MAMLPPDPIYVFKGEMLSVSCLEFQITQLHQRIFAGTQSGNVHVWSLKSKREIGNFKAGDDVCLSICLFPLQDNFVITQTKSGDVAFWTETDSQWTLKSVIKTDFFGFCKCQLFESVLFVPLKNSECEVISVKTQEPLRKVKVDCGSGEMMAFKVCVVGGKRVMLVGYEGHKIGVWDLEELKSRSCLVLNDCPMAVDYNEVSRRGLCGDASDKVVVFSLDDSLELRVERTVGIRNAGVASVRIRGDGKLAAVGCWDGKLRLYSWKSLVLLAVLDTHSSTVQDLAFTRNYKEGSKFKYLLAAASQDSTISLWDLYN